MLDDVLEDLGKLRFVQSFLFQKTLCQAIQNRAVLGQNLPSLTGCVIQERTHFLVNDGSKLIRIGALSASAGTVTGHWVRIIRAQTDVTYAIGHAVFSYERTGLRAGLLDIVRRAG